MTSQKTRRHMVIAKISELTSRWLSTPSGLVASLGTYTVVGRTSQTCKLKTLAWHHTISLSHSQGQNVAHRYSNSKVIPRFLEAWLHPEQQRVQLTMSHQAESYGKTNVSGERSW